MTPTMTARSGGSSRSPANSMSIIDIHLDVGNTPETMDIHLVCELTEEYRRGGRS